jgi:RHS repeat-associated protein
VTARSAPANSLSISTATNRITSEGFTYDASGNITNDGQYSYTYDAENRAVTGAAATYSYDGAGLRVKKVAGATTTRYIFSGTKVVAEYEGASPNPSSPTREYIYSGSALLVTIEGETTTYHHQDHLSARVNTDASGAVVGEQGHYPFGEFWYSSSTTTKWRFTSYERDAESANDYAIFRYHSNRLGRFLTPDPLAGSIASPQSLNRYPCAVNDPVNLVDPLGLSHLYCYIDVALVGSLSARITREGGIEGAVDYYRILIECFAARHIGTIPEGIDRPGPEGPDAGEGEPEPDDNQTRPCIPKEQLSVAQRVALWASRLAASIRGGIQGFGVGGGATLPLKFEPNQGGPPIGPSGGFSSLLVSTPSGQSFVATSTSVGVGWGAGGVAGVQYLSSASDSASVLTESTSSVGGSNAAVFGGGIEATMNYVLVTVGAGGGARGFVATPPSGGYTLTPICPE